MEILFNGTKEGTDLPISSTFRKLRRDASYLERATKLAQNIQNSCGIIEFIFKDNSKIQLVADEINRMEKCKPYDSISGEKIDLYVTARCRVLCKIYPDKIYKAVFICDSYKQAQIVKENVMNNSEFDRVNICRNKPKYKEQTHVIRYFNIFNDPKFYTKGHY